MRPSNEYDVAIFANHPVLVMSTGSVDLNLRQTRGGEENDRDEKRRTIERKRNHLGCSLFKKKAPPRTHS
jgi:hypothetical protein